MKTADWEDELKKLVPKKSSYDLISRTDAENFIESLLKKEIAYARQDQDCLNMKGNIEAQDKAYIKGKKEQRDKYYYEIENSTGTKEADYIDKQVNGGS